VTKFRAVLGALFFFAAGAGFATWMRGDAVAHPTDTQGAARVVPADPPLPETAELRPTDAPRPTARSPVSRTTSPIRRRSPPQEPPRADSEFGTLLGSVEFEIDGGSSKIGDEILARMGKQKTVRSRFLLAGCPVEGVEINGARSDAEGRIALTLPRNYRGFLVVQQPDGVQFRVDPPQDDAESADLGDVRLVPAARISGVVVDEDDRPVASASVALLSTDMDCRTMGEATTDSAGRFSIGRVGPYRYEVYARASPPKGGKAEAVGARLAAVRGGEDVRLVARPMFPVTFRLLDDATGKPISGTWISCYLRRPGAAHDASLHEHRADVAEVRLLLDAAGVYEAELWLAPAPWTFEIFYRRLDVVDVAADRENVIDVRLKKR